MLFQPGCLEAFALLTEKSQGPRIVPNIHLVLRYLWKERKEGRKEGRGKEQSEEGRNFTTLLYIYIYIYVCMYIYTYIYWRRQWYPTPVLLPGKYHGQRSLVGVHGVAESWTQLSDFTFTFHFHALEKEMTTHSSVLAWRIPGTGEPGGLPSMGSHRVGHD